MIVLPGRVERYCRVRTSTSNDEIPFPLDSDGFLEEPKAAFWHVDKDADGSLISPVAVAAKGPFVLLGEPGAGKTTVLHAIVDSLSSIDHKVEWFDGAELSVVGVERLLRVLRALPAGLAIDEGQSDAVFLTIVLDQIDESPVHANLTKLMKSSMQGRSTVGVRWLVACRAAEFPSGLAKVLERGGQACVLADLAPMTRRQAVELASSAGVNGEDLVEQAVAVGAGGLASIPLTLALLVELYRDGGGLTGTPLELFDRCVRLLLEETDTDRRSDLGVGLHQRLAIACRIAARLIMSGRRTIFTGAQLDGSRTDIESGSLANGTETVDGEVFEVTPELVKQTLSTALFAPRGKDRLGVVHSSMAAYLAATYLAEVPEQQLRELFLVASDDGHTSIPASLRETATWLITLSPAHGGWLTAADPQGLTAHSALIESDSVRERLVGALLDRAGEFELTAMPWHLYRSRLAYPGLPTQLADVLADVELGLPATRVAPADPTTASRPLPELIDATGAEVMFLTPAVLSVVDPADVPSVRLVVTGGDRIGSDLIHRWNGPARFFAAYGPTEGTIVQTWGEYRTDRAGQAPIGHPFGGVRLYVLDGDLEPVPYGAVGEVYVGGIAVGRGYRFRPALTAGKFLPDPYAVVPGARMYRTGDLVRRHPDGEMTFVGRVDTQVKVRGFRIELGEVQAGLRRVPGVSEAVAVVENSEQAGPARLVAYVVAASATERQIRDALRVELPDHLVPSRVFMLDAIPRTVNGKVAYAALRPPDGAAGNGLAADDPPGDAPAIAEAGLSTLLDQLGEMTDEEAARLLTDLNRERGGS